MKDILKYKELSNCSKKLWKQKYEDNFFFKLENYNSELRDKFFTETIKLIDKNFNKFYFLSGGSLLGLIREGNFIKWDDNIDLSFYLEEDTHEVLRNLQSVLIKNNYIARIFEKKNYSKISIYKYGYKIDLTSIFKINNTYVSNLYKFPADSIKDFKTILFKNIKIYIPADSNNYLNFLYGNWKVPEKHNYATIKSLRIENYRYIISNILNKLKNIFRFFK